MLLSVRRNFLVKRKQTREYCACFLMTHILAKDSDDCVRPGDCAENFRCVAHIDIICKSGGISVTSFDHSYIFRKR